MLNSYVGNYNNTYSQAKINEVLHSISLEVSEWKQVNTAQKFGKLHYEGPISNIVNVNITERPAENTPVIGVIQHKPAYLGYIGVDGIFHSSFNNIMSRIPYVYTTTVSFWQARNWDSRIDFSYDDSTNKYNSRANTYFFHNRWSTELRTNNNFNGHRIVAENANVNYFWDFTASIRRVEWLNVGVNINSNEPLNSVNVFLENNDINPIFNTTYGTTFSSNYAYISTAEYNWNQRPAACNTKPTYTIKETDGNNNVTIINVWYNFSDTENTYISTRRQNVLIEQKYYRCNYFAMTQPIVSNEGIITSAITKRYDYTNLFTIAGSDLAYYSSIDVIRNFTSGNIGLGVNMNCWYINTAFNYNSWRNTQYINYPVSILIGQSAFPYTYNNQNKLTYNCYNNMNGEWYTINNMNLNVITTYNTLYTGTPVNLAGWWIAPTLGGGNIHGVFSKTYDTILYYNNKAEYKTISYSPYQKYWNTSKPIYDYENYEQITAEQYSSQKYAFALPSRFIGRNVQTLVQARQLIYDSTSTHPDPGIWYDYIRDINAVLYTNCKIENTVVTSTYVSYDNSYDVSESVYVDIYYRKK